MPDVEALRSEYLAAHRDAERAETDVSQATTLVAGLEAAYATARRGESPDDFAGTLAELDHEIDGWEYDVSEIPSADPATFESFGVETVEDLLERLLEQFEDRAEEEFDILLSLIRAVAAGGGEEFEDPARFADELEAAFSDGDADQFEESAEALTDWFDDRGLTVEELSELAETGREPAERDFLERLQTAQGRAEVIDRLETVLADPDAEEFAAARTPVVGAIRAIESFAAARRDAAAAVTRQLTDEYPEDPTAGLSGMTAETPVLLLPTRLETRFEENETPEESEFVLKVRVYPDDVHVDTHERELTDEEVRWGTHFWEQIWWASHDLDETRLRETVSEAFLRDVDLSAFPEDPGERHAAVVERAWNQLVDRLGETRAAWVKHRLAPPTADDLLGGPHDPVADVDFDALRAAADRRPDAWTRPPRARALPDQWIAFAETNGTTKVARSEPVNRPLSVGPDPDQLGAATASTDATGLSDGEMAWVFDFDAALDVGMGLTVPLSAEQVAAGVDRLVVLGVSTALDAEAGGVALADLLEAHQYTDGLSFVERGTPTNDTRERTAGTPPGDAPSAFELACRDARLPPAPGSDGARAAELLGIDPSSLGTRPGHVFRGVCGARRTHDAASEAMNAALWPATWGYYLPHMLAPGEWTDPYQPRPEFLRWLESYRRHFVSYVRSGGPLPTLRVGRQPYGVVPTTDLDSWRPVETFAADPGDALPDRAEDFVYERLEGRDAEADLVRRLDSVRGTWEDAMSSVPSIESPDAPEAVVTDLLAMAGTSYGYRLRDLVGEEATTAVLGASDDLERAFKRAERAVWRVFDEHVPGGEAPRIGELLAGDDAPPVVEALVADDLDAYLRALRTEPHGALRRGPPGTGLRLGRARSALGWLYALLFDAGDASLLEALLYFGLLEEYRLGRVRLGMQYEDYDVEEWDQTPWGLFPEPQSYGPNTLTLWRALDQTVSERLTGHPEFDRTTTFGEALRTVPEVDRPFAAAMRAYETLQGIDPTLAERLLRETLDLSSHRFDAWATSVATRRLHGMRDDAGDGLYVGAYGYVENLRREDGSVDERSSKYVHAPSIGQATTAAILRSGHDARSDAYGDTLAVDLSADRVRDAKDLVEGVRVGHPLGELLGYRFERSLHENHPTVDLDQYVPGFRALAPLIEGKIERDGATQSDAAAEREVLDGVVLLERWRDRAIPWGQPVGSASVPLPSAVAGNEAYEAIRAELESLEASVDAVSDVLSAESVHQLVKGNPERAGGSLDALSRGEAPPDLSVTDTPRTGTACTHRLVALLDTDASTWGPDDAPRASAEPALNAWAGELLGEPERVVCRVAFRSRPLGGVPDGDEDDAATAPKWRVTTVRLADLAVCPLDVVYLVEAENGSWRSELQERISYQVCRGRADIDPADEIRVSFDDPAAWPDPAALGVDVDSDVGFGDFLEAARAVREVVTSGRAATARDLKPPGEEGGPGLLKQPLESRADAAAEELQRAVDSMDAVTAVFEERVTNEADGVPVTESENGIVSEHETLRSLADALAGLPSQLLAQVDGRLRSFDPEPAAERYVELAEVARGENVLFARYPKRDLTVDPRDPTLVGLTVAPPESVVSVVASVVGDRETFETVVERDGTFDVELDLHGVSDGDVIELEVEIERGPRITAMATYEQSRGDRSFLDTRLRGAAELAAAVDMLATSAAPVGRAAEALDTTLIRRATARIDATHWPTPNARDDLEAVLGVGDIAFPGFATPERWAEFGEIALALSRDQLTRDVLRESNLRELSADASDVEHDLRMFEEELENGLRSLEEAIEATETDPATTLAVGGAETLRAALLIASNYSVHASVPASARGATTEAVESLTAQANSVAAECTDRLTAATGAPDDVDGQLERLRALFGESFEVLAPFAASNPDELRRALAPDHSDALLGSNPLAAETWFQRVSRIRDVPREFGRALTYGETLGDLSPTEGSRFRVAQLPYADSDVWIGRPEAWEDEAPTGRLSIVAHVRGAQSTDRLVGLFVDEFVETVPNDTETTGLSFHYDKPGNRAPQTMLLAVPPTEDDWSLRTLADVVTESVDLAKIRTVDRQSLERVGHLLPAMTMASNETRSPAGPDTASVDTDELGPPWWYLVDRGGGN